MKKRLAAREVVFTGLFLLGALLLGAALAISAWGWVAALAQAGFISPLLAYAGVGLFVLTWLVPVTLVLERAG
jgi:hypothetical protein